MLKQHTDLPLAPETTLGLGGPARRVVDVESFGDLASLYAHEPDTVRDSIVIGGGSNVVIAPSGLNQPVIRWRNRQIRATRDGRHQLVWADAGVWWDDLVQWCVARDLAGIECLSGIPGCVGAAPIQNIGAYGQELSETLVRVHAVRRDTGERVSIPADACEFGYRTSVFKGERSGELIIGGIELRLRPQGKPAIRYGELEREVERRGGSATLARVRKLVLAIRRRKSMVYDPDDANSRSAGSFFTNPIVTPEVADRIASIDEAAPRYPVSGGVKLSAAWLIEQAGFPRGFGDGPAGLSEKHTLAIVNRGGATAIDVLGVAATVRRGVEERFGVTLVPEPELLGFNRGVDAVLREVGGK